MAPEMFDGAVSLRSDVYALGVMAFELLTGQRPFVGELEVLIAQHRWAALPSGLLRERNISAELIAELERAMHKNAMFRHKSARLFFRALQDAARGDPARSTPVEIAGLVAQCRAGPARSHAGPEETRTPSSYFDRLAELAEQKQGHRDQPLQDSAAAALTEASARAPTAENRSADSSIALVGAAGTTLTVDIPCVACNYNLRGLFPGGRCPECGRAMADSLRPDRLIFADPLWLARLARGLRLCRIGLGAITATGLAFVVMEGLLWFRAHERACTAITWALFFCFVLLFISGSLLVTGREWTEGSPNPRTRGIARLSMPALVLSLVALRYFDYAVAARLAVVVTSISLGISLVWYLRTLALRIPNHRAAGSAVNLAYLTLLVPILMMLEPLARQLQSERFVRAFTLFGGICVLGIPIAFFLALRDYRAAIIKTISSCVPRFSGPSGIGLPCKPPESAAEPGPQPVGPEVPPRRDQSGGRRTDRRTD